jgi:hypothetical protein
MSSGFPVTDRPLVHPESHPALPSQMSHGFPVTSDSPELAPL